MPTKPSQRQTLTFYCQTEKPLKHEAKNYTRRITNHSFTTYYELRTTHYAPRTAF